MITEEYAIGQVLRLSGLPGFPDGDAGQGELVRALANVALSFDHAATIIDRWLEANEKAPTPAGLYALAAQMATDEEAKQFHGVEKSFNDLVVNGFLYSVWTDRDVAIHRVLVTDGATEYARTYARQVLAGWEQYCAGRPDTWEVPMFRKFSGELPKRACPRCWNGSMNVGWEYLGPFRVRRCPCTVVYRPKRERGRGGSQLLPKPPQTQPAALPPAAEGGN